MIILAPALAPAGTNNFTPPSGNHSSVRIATLPDVSPCTSYDGEWASNFDIPWRKFPEAMMTALKNKQRPQKTDLLAAVRILCDVIMPITKTPGSHNLDVIAGKMVSKYPEGLSDIVCGKVIGQGRASLHDRLVRQFENRNRGTTSLKRKLLAEVKEGDGTMNKKKVFSKFLKDSYGCVNWQPNELPEGETEESQEAVRQSLITEFNKIESDRDMNKIKANMALTYVSQRLFINEQKPAMNIIRERWPFLLNSDFLLEHVNTLMGLNMLDKWNSFFVEKGLIIYNYALQCEKKGTQSILKQLSRASKELKNDLPKKVGSLLLLPSLLGEDEEDLFISYEVII